MTTAVMVESAADRAWAELRNWPLQAEDEIRRQQKRAIGTWEDEGGSVDTHGSVRC